MRGVGLGARKWNAFILTELRGITPPRSEENGAMALAT
jgi:hypothetical protein